MFNTRCHIKIERAVSKTNTNSVWTWNTHALSILTMDNVCIARSNIYDDI